MNNKGFSLVELLTVIVIIGILSTIGIVSYNAIRASVNKDFYENQKDNIILATEVYLQNNKSEIPGKEGQQNTIKLSELINGNYIDTIMDPHKEECSGENTIITITKKSTNEYIYEVYLSCNSFQG